MSQIIQKIMNCSLCGDRFLNTATAHTPRPVVWFAPNAKILIAGQAPGKRVHDSGKPFTDPSGDRLRDWLGVTEAQFYDKSLFGILPMAFCFPGYNAKGHDLAPPAICAKTWREDAIKAMPKIELTLLVGKYAQDWHLGQGEKMSDRMERWSDFLPNTFVLPHPSWRNTGWIKRNPWFEDRLLPKLRTAVKSVIEHD